MRFWITVSAALFVGGSLTYLGWQIGVRWLIDRYLDDPLIPTPAPEPEPEGVVEVQGKKMVPGTPVQKFTGFDPALRERTAMRRQAAHRIRQRASHVETGAQVADVLKLVRK